MRFVVGALGQTLSLSDDRARPSGGRVCGFERLAEVQEKILWICEAAHVPVIWATQVLESLAKNGQPSRERLRTPRCPTARNASCSTRDPTLWKRSTCSMSFCPG